jgi:phosphoglycerate kinase
LQKEIVEMEKVKNNFAHPAIAIIGGAKIETKLPVIKFFESIYDFVLVGGKIANEALDQKINFSEKVILPVDFIDNRLDIGPKTIAKFKEIISSAKTIIWNGPLGKFEEERYALGTYEILDGILKYKNIYTVVGGGETLEALEKRNAMESVGFVSTGGGAMLEYLGGEEMPGIEALSRS